jgi:hypothetical protein
MQDDAFEFGSLLAIEVLALLVLLLMLFADLGS